MSIPPVPVDLQVRGLRRDVTPDGALVFFGVSWDFGDKNPTRGTKGNSSFNCVFNPTPKGESSTVVLLSKRV